VEKLAGASYKLIQPVQFLNALRVFYRLGRGIMYFIFILVSLQYILHLFPWTRSIAVYLLHLVLDPVRDAGRGLINYLPKFIFLVLIFLVARYILKLVRVFFEGIRSGLVVIKSFYPEWAMPAFQIARFMIIVLAVVMAYPYIPFSDTSAFQGISVFLGVLFSLGSSSFIANIIAGYSLTFRRAYKIGDRINVNDSIGFVEAQNLMATRLRSLKNEEIVIPNSLMINSTVINFSQRALNPGVILHTNVGIGYDTPWRQVDSMLKEAADRTEGLLKNPPPYVLKRGLGDFAINYEINAYCNDATRLLHYYNLLHQNILDVFNENNVQIMTPNYVLDPEAPKVVTKENWQKPTAGEKESPSFLPE
jgi:small-conductance mechanosensitive channel